MKYLIVALYIILYFNSLNFVRVWDRCALSENIISATIYDRKNFEIYQIQDTNKLNNILGIWAGNQNPQETEWLDIPYDTEYVYMGEIIFSNQKLYIRLVSSESDDNSLYLFIFHGIDMGIYHPVCGVYKINKREFESIN